MAKLKKRGRFWHAWIGGRLVSTKCTDKEAARLRAAQFERESVDPHYKASHETTVGVACSEFMADLRIRVNQKQRSESTYEFYDYKCAHLVRLLGDQTPLIHIEANTVDGYRKQRHLEGAHPSTISKEIVTLSQVLKLAKRAGKYTHDLAAVLPHGLGDQYEPRERFLLPAELSLLLQFLNRQHAAAVLFVVCTSARHGELGRARVEDVNLDAGLVTLRGTKTKRARRVVPIVEPLLSLLQRAMQFAEPLSDGRLFGEWGNMWRDLQAACVRAGVPQVTPNDLRRTTASWLYGSGVDLSHLALILGHVDTRMLERVYARISPEALGGLIAQRMVNVDKLTVHVPKQLPEKAEQIPSNKPKKTG
jgi:integrase